MGADLRQGKLTTWKDDRGFGFIQPEVGGKEVFLHISALKGAGRRPRVGDTIVYELMTDADGKVRATKASIKGEPIRPASPKSASSKSTGSKRRLTQPQSYAVLFGLGGFILVAILSPLFRPSRSPSPIISIPEPACVIKGNISMTTGRKLYHLPGMEDYEATVIDPARGEQWFCSEAEAIARGWQKAPH